MQEIDETALMRMCDTARGYCRGGSWTRNSFVHNNVHAEAIDYMAILGVVRRLVELGFTEPVYALTFKEGAITMTYGGMSVYIGYFIHVGQCDHDCYIEVQAVMGELKAWAGRWMYDFEGNMLRERLRLDRLMIPDTKGII